MRPELLWELDWWHTNLTPEKRSTWTKNLLDVEGRHRAFPGVLLKAVVSMENPNVLDVGSGPLSCAAWGAEIGEMKLTAIDPLGADYMKLREKLGLDFPVDVVTMRGEDVAENFEAYSFDIVFTRNALDHAESPRECIEAASKVLRPGGLFIHIGKKCEGTTAKWGGSHRHDLFIDGEKLMRKGMGDLEGKSLVEGLPLQYFTSEKGAPGKMFSITYRKI